MVGSKTMSCRATSSSETYRDKWSLRLVSEIVRIVCVCLSKSAPDLSYKAPVHRVHNASLFALSPQRNTVLQLTLLAPYSTILILICSTSTCPSCLSLTCNLQVVQAIDAQNLYNLPRYGDHLLRISGSTAPKADAACLEAPQRPSSAVR